jgi:hypothetical protein
VVARSCAILSQFHDETVGLLPKVGFTPLYRSGGGCFLAFLLYGLSLYRNIINTSVY